MNRGLVAFVLVSLIPCLGPLGLANAADTQQPVAPWHIGVLLVGFAPDGKEAQAFRMGLRDEGYVEGRDVASGDRPRATTQTFLDSSPT